MKLEGGCYCGDVRYEYNGDLGIKGQCFCRECQHVTGGDSVLILGIAEDGFQLTKGALKQFSRSDLESPVTREFCENCGTTLYFHAGSLPGMVGVAAGCFTDPAFPSPKNALWVEHKYDWVDFPDGWTQHQGQP